MTAISQRAKTLIIALLVGVIALGTGIAVAHSDGTEIRITAMRLDDGRIEFAIQERDGEGWGERVLPRQRFFPTTSEGRWLNSTPITVGVVDELEPATATPTASPTPIATAVPSVESEWYYDREVDPLTDEVRTFAHVVLAGETTHSSGYTFGTAGLTLRCTGSRFEAYVTWGYSLFGNDDDEIQVKWRVDEEPLHTESWGEATSHKAAFASSPRTFTEALVGADMLIVEGREQSSYGTNDVVRATFNVTGLETSELHCWE